MEIATSTQRTGLECPSPLDIPELLDRILSFVDPFTLGCSAVLVSHQWNTAGHRYLERPHYAWQDSRGESKDLHQVLDMLPWMTRLRWCSEDLTGIRGGATQVSRYMQWALLLTGLEKCAGSLPISGRGYQPEEICLYNEMWNLLPPDIAESAITPQYRLMDGSGARLRELELFGQLFFDRLMLLLPLLPCLTKLKLMIGQVLGGSLQMSRIVRACPLLEYLHIASTSLQELPGPWIIRPPRLGLVPLFDTRSRDTDAVVPLALKSLVLYGVALSQHLLHDFLAHTPHLKVLKAVGIKMLNDRTFHFDRFNKCIKDYPFRLNYFHFSCDSEPHDGVTSDLCPNPHDRIIASCDFTPGLVQNILTQPDNNITTLELFCRSEWRFYRFYRQHPQPPESMLHDYLCSSPHLLHVKAPHYSYQVEHMDLHGRLTKLLARRELSTTRFKNRTWEHGVPGIWACRKLRTLHIRILTPDRRYSNLTEPYSEFARVAFGYIARVCPDLRDLVLGNDSNWHFFSHAYPPLDLRLQGGFCLLGRLQHLERIEIGRFSDCAVLSPQNMEWMIKSGRTEEKKAERREFVQAMWKRLRLMSHIRRSPAAAAAAATTLASVVEGDNGPIVHFDWTNVDPQLREELKYLGWPIEVQVFFDELDKPAQDGGGIPCFPALRYSCIGSTSGFDLSPEQDYQRFVLPTAQK